MSEMRVYYTEDEPFSTPCCGMRMSGDVILGETLCPYCEQPVTAFDDEEIEVSE